MDMGLKNLIDICYKNTYMHDLGDSNINDYKFNN